MIKVLHTCGDISNGGIESVMLNIFSSIDKENFKCSILLMGSKNVWEKELASLNVSVDYISGKDYKELAKKYYKYFKANKTNIDIVHIHFQNTKCFYIARAARKCKIKTVVHSHLQGIDSGLVYRICRFLLNRYTDARIGCSRMAVDYMFGKRKDNIIIKNAIDINKFAYNENDRTRLRKEYGLDGKFVVGHIGRFCAQKNHGKLLSIFGEIKKLKDNAVLVLIGWGELEEKIKKLVSCLPYADSVIFIPPTNNVAVLYNMFDVFVFPSLYEGLGIVGIEAQANGLPCYVSDTIPPEIKVSPQLTFIDLKASDAEWAEKIFAVSGRRDCADSIIRSGYEIKSSIIQLEDVYKRIIGNR